ncbi:IgLON family member 5, partial [Ophiophagus hannah]
MTLEIALKEKCISTDSLISGSDGLQIQNERTRSILLFTNVTARHYGNYTCLASNSLGSYNVSLRLINLGHLGNDAEQGNGNRHFRLNYLWFNTTAKTQGSNSGWQRISPPSPPALRFTREISSSSLGQLAF